MLEIRENKYHISFFPVKLEKLHPFVAGFKIKLNHVHISLKQSLKCYSEKKKKYQRSKAAKLNSSISKYTSYIHENKKNVHISEVFFTIQSGTAK